MQVLLVPSGADCAPDKAAHQCFLFPFDEQFASNDAIFSLFEINK
jgi:hypothetical protein